MRPRPVVTASRIVFPRPAMLAHPYAACPTPDALTAAVGRDADPLREAYLKVRRERGRGMLGGDE